MQGASLVPDALWEQIEALLPAEPTTPRVGRPRVPNRDCLAGIIFVLKSGIAWNLLPSEFGCGSGSTCWRRLRDWTEAGVWTEVHERLLNLLGRAGQIDWSRAVIDSASVRAVFGGTTQAQIPRIEPRRAANAM